MLANASPRNPTVFNVHCMDFIYLMRINDKNIELEGRIAQKLHVQE